MYHSETYELANVIKDFHLPKYTEIPNVGLYLEQTAKYISEALSPLFKNAITGSMISNYVKKGLVSNPVKKQYDREQIAYLIFIALVKNVLSMDDIKTVINVQKESYEVVVAYNYFAEEFERLISYVFNESELGEETDTNNSGEKRMLRNIIITVAHKIYLEKYFSFIGEKN